MDRVRVGIVGCGDAAQVMHLPSLRMLEDRFAVEVSGADRVIRVAYGSSFVRNAPVLLTVESASGGGATTSVAVPTWEDPFVSEWRAFGDAICDGAPVRASAEDARLDLELCLELARAITRSTDRSLV